MLIKDRVYGEIEINEPVLVELMQSKALARLKGINQHSTLVFYDKKFDITRYEHCVGVMILLKRLGASLKEQIAGLLHDVPHAAFSHVIDRAFGDVRTDDYHERFHEKVIMNSDIPGILAKYGYDARDFLDEKKYGLLERSVPDLCADRIDYFFRDTIVDRKINLYDGFFRHLVVKNGEIIIDNKEAALEFGREYLKTSRSIWTDEISIAIFEVLAQCFKIAHDKGYLTEDDFFVDDKEMMAKLRNANDSEINRRLAVLNENFAISFDKENYDFYRNTKVRQIDPKIAEEGKRVSEIDKEFLKELDSHRKWVEAGHYIKVEGL